MKALRPLLLIVAVFFAGLGSARAQTDLERKARTHFGASEYREALAIYAQLYADTLHPTYLRNVGRCYQNLGEPDKAISSFREYLRKAKTVTAADRAEVEGYIAELEESKRAQAAADARARPAPRPAPTVVPAPAPAPRASATATATPPRDQGNMRLMGAALVGVGVATAVTGFVVYRKGVSKRDAIMQDAGADGGAGVPYNEANSNYATFGKVGIGLMAGGGAALVTGALLYLFHRESGSPGGGTAVSLGLFEGGGAVQVSRCF